MDVHATVRRKGAVHDNGGQSGVNHLAVATHILLISRSGRNSSDKQNGGSQRSTEQ